MTPEAFEETCLALPATSVVVQWGDSRVYKVGDKIFAILGADGDFSFKASEIAFEALTSAGPGKPAPYLARAKWVWLPGPDALPDEDVRALLQQAHGLVAAKLSRAVRGTLGL